MATVQDVLRQKGTLVFSIHPSASVLSATKKMNRHKIGALVVIADNQVVGMFTERDVLRRIVAEQRDPSAATVGEVMTEEVICCTPRMELDEVAAIMKQARVRHLPVCVGKDPDEHSENWCGNESAEIAGDSTGNSHESQATNGPGQLLGMISIGDVSAQHAHSQEATIEFLNGYIYGRV
jgi:CBS domain-containing protein